MLRRALDGMLEALLGILHVALHRNMTRECECNVRFSGAADE
jgi:hypothetical protein